VAELHQYASFSFSKTVLLALTAEGIVFVHFFLGEIVRCHSTLYRVSVTKWWNQLSSLVKMRIKSSPTTTCHSINCEEMFISPNFCCSFCKKKNPTLSGTTACLFQSLLPFLLHVSILTDEHNCCSFVSLRKGSSPANSTGLTGGRQHRGCIIYLINKYISLSDICFTVHHWYK
jgi:hypothetical protein